RNDIFNQCPTLIGNLVTSCHDNTSKSEGGKASKTSFFRQSVRARAVRMMTKVQAFEFKVVMTPWFLHTLRR
ncbi:hypothetical protein, partial [Salinicola salarius]|uniref:hypothetical protein n=1 Tax=Salinicola salarius TaxID=430457 RepID=UPI0026EB1099